MLYIVINVFIGGPLENQLVEGQPSLKELNMKHILSPTSPCTQRPFAERNTQSHFLSLKTISNVGRTATVDFAQHTYRRLGT